MIGTILDYLTEYGNKSLGEMRFTEVDAAILCKLSYFNFDEFVSPPEAKMPSVSLKQIMLMEDHKKLINKGKYGDVHKQIIESMLAGKRFCELRVAAVSNYMDKESQTQFAAVTFLLNSKLMFVVFRGTDSSIIGLREDFNLLYMDHAPCHEYAINYIKQISEQYNRTMYLGGHSKGGHLATYAAMFVPKNIQNRIHRIYSLDGLGLRPSVMKEGHYEDIEKKVFKLIPQSSLIGMMLQEDDSYDVVHSTGVMLVQHNVNTWVVDGRKFVRDEKLNNNAIFVEHTFNGWLDSQDDENRRKFIDAMFYLVDICEAEHLHELVANGGHKFNQIIAGMKGLDEETSKQVRMVLRAFVEVSRFYLKMDVGENIKESTAKSAQKIKESTAKSKQKIKESTAKSTGKIKSATAGRTKSLIKSTVEETKKLTASTVEGTKRLTASTVKGTKKLVDSIDVEKIKDSTKRKTKKIVKKSKKAIRRLAGGKV